MLTLRYSGERVLKQTEPSLMDKTLLFSSQRNRWPWSDYITDKSRFHEAWNFQMHSHRLHPCINLFFYNIFWYFSVTMKFCSSDSYLKGPYWTLPYWTLSILNLLWTSLACFLLSQFVHFQSLLLCNTSTLYLNKM